MAQVCALPGMNTVLRHLGTASIVLLLLPTPARAQTTIEGHLGRSWFVDEAWFDVPHVVGGVAVRRQVSDRTRLGGRVVYMRGPERDRDWFALAEAAFLFRKRAVRAPVAPYWFAALGVMRHSNDDGRRRPVQYGPAVEFGIGTRIAAARHLTVAPELGLGILMTRVSVSIGWTR